MVIGPPTSPALRTAAGSVAGSCSVGGPGTHSGSGKWPRCVAAPTSTNGSPGFSSSSSSSAGNNSNPPSSDPDFSPAGAPQATSAHGRSSHKRSASGGEISIVIASASLPPLNQTRAATAPVRIASLPATTVEVRTQAEILSPISDESGKIGTGANFGAAATEQIVPVPEKLEVRRIWNADNFCKVASQPPLLPPRCRLKARLKVHRPPKCGSA